MESVYKTYPHNPPHYFVPNEMYMVTGSILYRQRLLLSDVHKAIVLDAPLERAAHWTWDLSAWAILENHYHFVSQAPADATTLSSLLR